MSYWDKIKQLISPEVEEKKDEEIVFSPEELREMRDPDTAVGRLLNPYDVEPYAVGGARELYYKGLGSPDKSVDTSKVTDIESVGPIADAYIKDAEKRGIVHPHDDRITKIYAIIDDFKKRKGLEDIQIKHDLDRPGVFGLFNPKNKVVRLSEDIHPFSIDPKEQKLKADRHLNTAIHELMHAEDFKNDPEGSKKDYYGHFKDQPKYWHETSAESGNIAEIERAALQRLANMGTKKVRKKDE